MKPRTNSIIPFVRATLIAFAASLAASIGLAATLEKPTLEKLTIDGKSVSIKVPAQAAPGKPWLWVGEFGGHLRSLEDGLVEKGWHVVYVSVSNQFGSPRAMATWEKVYDELHGKRGLSAKPALLGISRGGLYSLAPRSRERSLPRQRRLRYPLLAWRVRTQSSRQTQRQRLGAL
jgi:hypothetical protein